MKCSTMTVDGKKRADLYVDCCRRGQDEYVGTNVNPQMFVEKEGCLASKEKCWAGTSLIMYSIVEAVYKGNPIKLML